MSIDLSKITPKELPKKTVKVNILGVEQEQEIRPLSGNARIKYWALDVTDDPGQHTIDRVTIALTNGAGLSTADALKLSDIDWMASVHLANEIHQFTLDFDEKIRKEKENAEKNLQPEALTDTAS